MNLNDVFSKPYHARDREWHPDKRLVVPSWEEQDAECGHTYEASEFKTEGLFFGRHIQIFHSGSGFYVARERVSDRRYRGCYTWRNFQKYGLYEDMLSLFEELAKCYLGESSLKKAA